jgi:hypothetical protein
MALKMTVAFSGNQRVQPLVDGRVKPENIDLEVVTVAGGMLFFRNLQYDEFDASEMSISETLLAKERGDGFCWDWSALPVFSPGTGLAPGQTVSMDRYGGTPLTGNPRIRLLLDDAGRAVVAEFYRKTGAFMANHHVIVQNRILKDNPWAAMALFKAFQESKELAYQDARRQRSTYRYFQGNDEQDHTAIFGEYPYPLGLKAMRPTVERAMQGSLE